MKKEDNAMFRTYKGAALVTNEGDVNQSEGVRAFVVPEREGRDRSRERSLMFGCLTWWRHSADRWLSGLPSPAVRPVLRETSAWPGLS